jgi:hypothetical protein
MTDPAWWEGKKKKKKIKEFCRICRHWERRPHKLRGVCHHPGFNECPGPRFYKQRILSGFPETYPEDNCTVWEKKNEA